MSDTIDVTISLPIVAWEQAKLLADRLGLTPEQYVTRAIGFAQTIKTARQCGHWVGAATDRDNLEIVIVPPR